MLAKYPITAKRIPEIMENFNALQIYCSRVIPSRAEIISACRLWNLTGSALTQRWM
jgi:hypothetical protein